jgi:formylglycine-generating enzyme required for sulfatase activity
MRLSSLTAWIPVAAFVGCCVTFAASVSDHGGADPDLRPVGAQPAVVAAPLASEEPPSASVAAPAPADTVTPASGLPDNLKDHELFNDMVLVPAGRFLMGVSGSGGGIDVEENPQHEVDLAAFLIDRTEVTYRAYLAFLHHYQDHRFCHPDEPAQKDHRPRSHPAMDEGFEEPITGVDWFDAYAFCAWSGKRLPTEAEWEKAARGTDGRAYPWGDDWQPHRANARGKQDGYRGLAPVGSFPLGASPYGAMDMAGNAAEWVADWFQGGYYRTSDAAQPGGPDEGMYRVLRGGSWADFPPELQVTERVRHHPSVPNRRYTDAGFRCARDAPPADSPTATRPEPATAAQPASADAPDSRGRRPPSP